MRRVRTIAVAAALAAPLALPAVAAPPERGGAAGTGTAGTGAAGTGAAGSGTAGSGTAGSGAAASPLVALPARLVSGADPAVQVRPAYRCAEPAIAVRAVCAYVIVPLDHTKPDGRKIKIAISVIRATAPADKILGVLLVHPGGPGAHGLAKSAAIADALGSEQASRWNIVGVDLRGINGSVPRLTCDPDYKRGPRPDYRPTTGAAGPVSSNEKAWLARVKAYAGTCGRKYPDILPHLTTRNFARDLEVLRLGLGVNKLSMWGFSYGSYLSMVYATLYPTRVDKLVLDGISHPGRVWYDQMLARDRAFEVTINRFFAWVASHSSTYGLGTTGPAVRERYAAEQAELRRRPVGRVGPAEWQDVFLRAAYHQAHWPGVAAAFRAWVAGERAPLTTRWYDLEELGNDGIVVNYLGATCADAPWPRNYATWRRDAFATAKKAPFDTWGGVWNNAPCIFWPVRGGTPVKVGSAKVPGFLLVSSTLDGATPYAGALDARRRFPTARLVAERGGVSHTVSFVDNRCVGHFISAYLLKGTLPPRSKYDRADVVCSAKRLPTP